MFEPVEDKQKPSTAATVSNVKFAFGLKKANDKKIPTGSNLLAERDKKGRLQKEEDGDDVTPEKITHVEDRKVKGTKEEKKEGPLVIPMIVKNDWRTERLKEQTIKNGENIANGESVANVSSQEVIPNEADDLAARARAALLNEAKGGEDDSTDGGVRSVPLLMANKVPAGFETDDKLDVSLRPDEEEADYDSVPIEEFGLAVLRGMGWKEGDPIGNTNKQLVKAKIPELRPKGLGLGADRSKANKLSKQPGGQASSSKSGDAEENLLLKIGSYVKIVAGPHRESYGKVESFDEDNARVVVRLAIGNTAVTVSQFGVEVVSLKDYERDSKCINKSKYDRYKKEQESQFANHFIEEDPLAVTDDHLHKHKSKSKKRKHDRSRSASPVETKKSNKSNGPPWVRADLRVRFVDKKYKNGRYYNTKMQVFDVVSKENCSLRDEKGRIIDGISESWLETIIPKSESQPVMVLRGDYRGEVGTIVDRDRKRERASVQLSRTQDIVTLSYDDVCEFCGDATIYLD